MAVAVAAAGSAVSAVDRRSVSARPKHGASIKRVYRDAILKRLRTRKQQ